MTNPIIDDISTLPPTWNHPVLPGNAVQGMILMTKNDFKEPPQSTEDFMWVLMENILGVHNIRIIWDEDTNVYTIQRSEGHMNNNGTWIEEWFDVGTITGLSAEAEQKIRDLVYVSYRYDTTTANTLKVYGVKKDDTETLLCDVSFASTSYVDTVAEGLQDNINTEATTREEADDALDERVTALEEALTNIKTLTVLKEDGTTETISFYGPNTVLGG